MTSTYETRRMNRSAAFANPSSLFRCGHSPRGAESVYATGAIPIGVPGCPEFAAWTASMQSVRIVVMHRSSSSVAVLVVIVILNHLPFSSSQASARATWGFGNRRPGRGRKVPICATLNGSVRSAHS